MYKKEFYHTKSDALNEANEAAGKEGFVKEMQTDADNFDFIALDAINDDRDGVCPAFWVFNEKGEIEGVFAYAEMED